ncbi:tripartite tricarboxylate transporter substrate binding protein [Aquabacterium sp. J223]|uniref:Bug family tripartite tricarboxylate transporter substrate binding protein n=1 Tax=Aquabacterium sp. J223 TaxID=2898431 RepID=UPI0021AD954B|nr:tripartite tricarboxylate transporter substrate binding protein [Aquabacterium sp. J223]UUX95303.1 tripartite tricarboxylate transporter substrate binding protein [Aquabacterium sp. J223]
MTRNQLFKRVAAAAITACCALPATTAWGQAYPSRQIKLVVPFSPGGLPDTVARILSTRLQESLGQPVIVENKPGGSGAIAAATITQSPADGYTFLVTDGSSLAIAPLISKSITFDTERDFTPVSLIGTAPLFLAVNSKVPAKNLDEFIALAKSKPGAMNYGSAGNGSIHHLTAEAMKQGLGIFITHIPYRGSGTSVPAMVGGDVEMVFASPPSLMGFVKNGQARLLAINSPKRSQLAPEVPALSERIKGFDFAFNVAMLAKAGTPPDVVQRVSTEVAKIVKRPDVIDQLAVAGVEAVGGTPAQLARALKDEAGRVTAAAKHANLRPD